MWLITGAWIGILIVAAGWYVWTKRAIAHEADRILRNRYRRADHER